MRVPQLAVLLYKGRTVITLPVLRRYVISRESVPESNINAGASVLHYLQSGGMFEVENLNARSALIALREWESGLRLATRWRNLKTKAYGIPPPPPPSSSADI